MEIPVNQKFTLTINEAAAYYNIGIHKLRRLAEDNKDTFSVQCGNRFLIIRTKFEEYLINSSTV
jgi:excisionase family DNA binding protein